VGKDRTGVLAAMLLAAAGVIDEDIIHDYTLSAPFIPQTYGFRFGTLELDLRKDGLFDPFHDLHVQSAQKIAKWLGGPRGRRNPLVTATAKPIEELRERLFPGRVRKILARDINEVDGRHRVLEHRGRDRLLIASA
jgi:hypothetical protein